jgi:hypothetical protein
MDPLYGVIPPRRVAWVPMPFSARTAQVQFVKLCTSLPPCALCGQFPKVRPNDLDNWLGAPAGVSCSSHSAPRRGPGTRSATVRSSKPAPPATASGEAGQRSRLAARASTRRPAVAHHRRRACTSRRRDLCARCSAQRSFSVTPAPCCGQGCGPGQGARQRLRRPVPLPWGWRCRRGRPRWRRRW